MTIIYKHNYHAEWTDNGIIVTDSNGNEINVEYGVSLDMRTCSVYVQNVGFIGGWKYPSKARKFKDIVNSINSGYLYMDMDDDLASY